MESIELFTGAGGLAIGTHVAGFHHRALVEWDRNACDTLRENVRRGSLAGIADWEIIEGDVREESFRSLEGIDLVAGGVPCQPFSIGGRHRGMFDHRDMFPQFIRVVREVKPRAFLIENVKGIARPGFRNYLAYVHLQLSYPTVLRRRSETWDTHLKRLEATHTRGSRVALSYQVVYRVLNAADFGVPQVRERFFMVGIRSDLGVSWHFPVATHGKGALIREQTVTGDYWRRHGIDRPDPRPVVTASGAQQALFAVPQAPWRTVRDALCGLPEPNSSDAGHEFQNHVLRLGARAYPGHSGSPLDLPSKTLKAGVHGVPGGENMLRRDDGTVRYYTAREAARIQTFPDSWVFRGAWSEEMRQIGNAVPVQVAEILGRSLRVALSGGESASN